ncbi:MAG: DUF502 domain-containing protein [Phycisphaerales bacterium]|nr:DUF502 domain-containing protein [Phycisphaerales bacterium]
MRRRQIYAMAQQKTFMGDFKRFFGRGLGILLPSVLTLWILYQLLLFLNNNVGEPINRGVRILFIEVYPRLVTEEKLPTWFRVTQDEVDSARVTKVIPRVSELSDATVRDLLRRDKLRQLWRQHWYLQATGLILAIVIIYFAGRFLGGYLGRQVYDRLEALLARVPGFKQVYPHVKQVVQMILGDKPIAFNRVVLVEYPGKDIWTIGLVTGPSMSSISKQAGGDVVTVFIPTTPTPFTGFAINVRRDAVLDLPMSVEEAFRFFVTGGVLVPEHLANRATEQPARVAEPLQSMVPGGIPSTPEVANSSGPAAGDAPGGAPGEGGV